MKALLAVVIMVVEEANVSGCECASSGCFPGFCGLPGKTGKIVRNDQGC